MPVLVQDAVTEPVAIAVSTIAGWVTVAEAVAVQPLASVMVTV